MFSKTDYVFLVLALLSTLLSLAIWFGIFGDSPSNKENAIFVGLWVPSILALGLLFRLASKERSG